MEGTTRTLYLPSFRHGPPRSPSKRIPLFFHTPFHDDSIHALCERQTGSGRKVSRRPDHRHPKNRTPGPIFPFGKKSLFRVNRSKPRGSLPRGSGNPKVSMPARDPCQRSWPFDPTGALEFPKYFSHGCKTGHSCDVSLVFQSSEFSKDLGISHGQRGTRIPMASARVLTPKTSIGASGKRETALRFPWGMMACLKPNRAASASRGPIWET